MNKKYKRQVIGLKIFIDSGKLDEIQKVKDYGLLDRVTTNPFLIKEAIGKIKFRGGSLNIREYIKEILTVPREGMERFTRDAVPGYKDLLRS